LRGARNGDGTAPFPIVRIEPIESESSNSVKTDALGAKVLELYSKLKGAGRQLPEKVDRSLSRRGDMVLADLMIVRSSTTHSSASNCSRRCHWTGCASSSSICAKKPGSAVA
jgi:hypothetical protein